MSRSLVVKSLMLCCALALGACSDSRKKPVAVIIVGGPFGVGDLVELDGSTSKSKHPLRYRWTLLSIPTNSLSEINSPEGQTAAFQADAPGDYVIRLVVTDRTLDRTEVASYRVTVLGE